MKKTPIYIVIILILTAGIFVGYKLYSKPKSQSVESVFSGLFKGNFGETASSTKQNIPPVQITKNDTLSYTHPTLGFVFSYPGNYKVSDLEDDQGETILIQDSGKGAQIYITGYNSKEEFNSALVRRELAGQKLENLRDIEMPGGGFLAVSFSSKDASLGEIWDVWFVQKGKLFQITSQAGQDELLKKLVESFRFE